MTSQDAVFGNDGDDDDWGEGEDDNEEVSWAAAQMQVFHEQLTIYIKYIL